MKTIKSRSDFERVYSEGRRYNHPLMRMVIVDSASEGGPGRVAFAAPKRLGNAVFRNRSKRVMRETARAVGLPAAGKEVILFAARGTATATPAALVQALQSLCNRAGVSLNG